MPAEWSQVACDILAQKYLRKAGVPTALKPHRRGGGRSRLATAPHPRFSTSSLCCRRPCAARRRDQRQAIASIASRAPGRIGAGRAAISIPPRMPARSSTNCGRCSRGKWARPTHRNGSTPGFIGPTASTGRRKAISTPMTAPARCARRKAPTSIRSRMPASFSRSPTISSTKAGSWICGCARPGCSNTARAPARISPSCARRRRAAVEGGGPLVRS